MQGNADVALALSVNTNSWRKLSCILLTSPPRKYWGIVALINTKGSPSSSLILIIKFLINFGKGTKLEMMKDELYHQGTQKISCEPNISSLILPFTSFQLFLKLGQNEIQ